MAMENGKFETLITSGAPPAPFPPRPRSHLKSRTFSTLVRILPICFHESLRSPATGIAQDRSRQGSGNKEPLQGNEIEMHEEAVVIDSTEARNSFVHKSPAVDENFEAICLQDTGFSEALSALETELEDAIRMKGNEELIQGNSPIPSTSSPNHREDRCGNILESNQEVLLDSEQDLTMGDVNVGQLQLEIENKNCEVSKALDTSLDEDSMSEVSKLGENGQGNGSSLEKNVMEEAQHKVQQKKALRTSLDGEMISEVSKQGEVGKGKGSSLEKNVLEEAQHDVLKEKVLDTSLDEEMMSEVCKLGENAQGKGSSLEKDIVEETQDDVPQKDMEIETSVCTTVTKDASYCVDAEGGIEEGEISGDDVYIDVSMEDDVPLEDMVGEEQISKGKGLMDEEESTGNEQNRADDKNNEPTSCFNTVGNGDLVSKEDLKESGRRKMIQYDYDAVFHGEPDIRGITSSKKDAGACNKKKRGNLSDERKEKRKRKKKIKRAEKNRKLGVRRLKVLPVSKPKTVTYCRHYLRGRCQQGAECKFSHDTVPLTKSKPCCHFARQACMKGEDCPFDHQLSKYPCTNYVSQGSCVRGDNCRFSHKVPPQEGAPTVSIIGKPDMKPSPSPSTSNPNANASSAQNGIFSWKNTQESLVASLLKMPAQAPKGINFLSLGKSPMDCSGKRAGLSLNKDDNATMGNPTTQTTSGVSQNTNQIPVRNSPAVVPKGINLLSFGKDPLATIPLNKGNRIEKKPTKDSDKCKTGCLSPRREDRLEVGNQANRIVPPLVQKESPKRTPPSVGKAPIDGSTNQKQARLPSGMNNNIGICIQERENASMTMPWRVAASPLARGQDSDRSVDEHNKNKSSSSSSLAPKALLSTLSFAAKVEPRIRVNPTAGATAVGAKVNKEPKESSTSSSSQTESMKASTILDFLYGDGE